MPKKFVPTYLPCNIYIFLNYLCNRICWQFSTECTDSGSQTIDLGNGSVTVTTHKTESPNIADERG